MTTASHPTPSPALALEILDRGGAAERRLPLEALPCEIGRSGAGIALPEDAAMAERAARLDVGGLSGSLRLEPIEAPSGVWRRVRDRAGILLRAGDQLWLGAQVLVVEPDATAPGGWQLRHHGPDGELRERIPVPVEGLMIGRRSALVLDASDPGLSRRHAQVAIEEGALRFYDRGARNGSWIRLDEPAMLTAGDEFRIGASHFRVVAVAADAPTAAAAAQEEPHRSLEAPMADRMATPGLGARLRRLGRQIAAEREGSVDAVAADASEEGGSPGTGEPGERVPVVIDAEEGGVTLSVVPGTTILAAVRAAGLERGAPVDWECEDGGCGVCVLAVVEGADRLDPPDPGTGEMNTIQVTEQVAPDPSRYRLACLARVRGPVRLRKP